ncbi:hypothetical protein BLNAU_16650 [Blattamonas nauphoetae]|uniref:Uncharacterized protein n=1 Tax=Blattamonas nauphoetae TaxID=2049346 RepID=A0ABQ9XAP0_9EUKA|nr:hypothetical protein BLNAU_16650 [Blattamonas nauphoetae]
MASTENPSHVDSTEYWQNDSNDDDSLVNHSTYQPQTPPSDNRRTDAQNEGRTPLFALSIKIKNENQKLLIYDDTSVDEACNEFCTNHQLPPSAKANLIDQANSAKYMIENKGHPETHSERSNHSAVTAASSRNERHSVVSFFESTQPPKKHGNVRATVGRLLADHERRQRERKMPQETFDPNCTFQPNMQTPPAKSKDKFALKKKKTDGSFVNRFMEDTKQRKARAEQLRKEREEIERAQQVHPTTIIMSTADIEASTAKLSAPLRDKQDEKASPSDLHQKPKRTRRHTGTDNKEGDELDVTQRLIEDAKERRQRKQEREMAQKQDCSFHPKSQHKSKPISPLTLCRDAVRKERRREESGDETNSPPPNLSDIQQYEGLDYSEIDVVERLTLDAELRRREKERQAIKQYSKTIDDQNHPFKGENATFHLLRTNKGDDDILEMDGVPDEAEFEVRRAGPAKPEKVVLSRREARIVSSRLHSEREEFQRKKSELEEMEIKRIQRESSSATTFSRKTTKIVEQKRMERLRCLYSILYDGMREIEFEEEKEDDVTEAEEPTQGTVEEEDLELPKEEDTDIPKDHSDVSSQTSRDDPPVPQQLQMEPEISPSKAANQTETTPSHFANYTPPNSPQSTQRSPQEPARVSMLDTPYYQKPSPEMKKEEVTKEQIDESPSLDLNLAHLCALFTIIPPITNQPKNIKNSNKTPVKMVLMSPSKDGQTSQSQNYGIAYSAVPPFGLTESVWNALFFLLNTPHFMPNIASEQNWMISMDQFVKAVLKLVNRVSLRQSLLPLVDTLTPLQNRHSHAPNDKEIAFEENNQSSPLLLRTGPVSDTLTTQFNHSAPFNPPTSDDADFVDTTKPTFSFTPKTNANAKKLAEKRKKELERELQAIEEGSSHRAGRPQTTTDRFKLEQAVRAERQKQLDEKVSKEQMKECTFKPKTRNKTKAISNRKIEELATPKFKVEAVSVAPRSPRFGMRTPRSGFGDDGRPFDEVERPTTPYTRMLEEKKKAKLVEKEKLENTRKLELFTKTQQFAPVHSLQMKSRSEMEQMAGVDAALRELELDDVLQKLEEQEQTFF